MQNGKAKVIRVGTSAAAGHRGELPVDTLRRMVELGLRTLTDCRDPVEAWSRFFTSRDTVGIKVNCLGGRNMCTRPALAAATALSLQSAGISAGRIVVWDRSSRELERCGFPLNRRKNGSFLCLGTDEKGVGYEEDLTVQGSVGSRYSTLLTRHCSALINMPVLKDHGLCGVTAALKNIFGALHNPNKYHEERCNPFIADANAAPGVRQKARLAICDATLIQYKGGPGHHPQWTRALGAILVAEDPVALDSVGVGILNQARAENGLPPVEPGGGLPAYLVTAAGPQHRLGRCRNEEIELIEQTLAV